VQQARYVPGSSVNVCPPGGQGERVPAPAYLVLLDHTYSMFQAHTCIFAVKRARVRTGGNAQSDRKGWIIQHDRMETQMSSMPLVKKMTPSEDLLCTAMEQSKADSVRQAQLPLTFKNSDLANRDLIIHLYTNECKIGSFRARPGLSPGGQPDTARRR